MNDEKKQLQTEEIPKQPEVTGDEDTGEIPDDSGSNPGNQPPPNPPGPGKP